VSEHFHEVLLEIFILYPAVKEFWKSVKIWESYWQTFGGFLLGSTLYMLKKLYWSGQNIKSLSPIQLQSFQFCF